MIASIDLAGFFTLGLLGGLGHCTGMCSPFVILVARRFVAPEASRPAALMAQLWYTAGRVLTYGILGTLAGVVGGAVEFAGSLLGLQRAAAFIAGVVLLGYGLISLADLVPRLGRQGGAVFGKIVSGLKGRMPGHPFVLGLFLGLLPCGLLYSALIGAISRGGALAGGLALVAFGLGTAPALLAVSLADELLARNRTVINRISQVFLVVMGAWFLWTSLSR